MAAPSNKKPAAAITATKTGVSPVRRIEGSRPSARSSNSHPSSTSYFADFPRDLKNARALGEQMAFGDRGDAVVRIGFAATVLAACARTGVAVSRVARVSGLGKPRVSAFYEALREHARLKRGTLSPERSEGERVLLLNANSPPAASTGTNTAARRRTLLCWPTPLS